MKASEILNWIIEYNLNGENLNQIEISDDDEFQSQSDFIETFFGCVPDKKIPNGNYLYVWSDTLPEDFYVHNLVENADLVLDSHEDYKIYLFRIED